MPIDVQKPTATRALVEEYGLKGRYRLALDDVIVPVALVGDVRPTTVSGATYQDQALVSAVAGEQAMMLVRGGVEQDPFTTVLHSLRARAVGTATDLLIGPQNTTAFVLTGVADMVGKNRLDPRRPPSPIIATVGTNAAPTTSAAETVRLPANEDVVIPLTGWELPHGPQVLGEFARLSIFATVANIALVLTLTWSIRRDE